MSDPGTEDFWNPDLILRDRRDFLAARLAKAEKLRPAITKVSFCGLSPKKVERLAAPVADCIERDGLPALLHFCRGQVLGVEVFQQLSSPGTVRVVIHWSCCFKEVFR